VVLKLSNILRRLLCKHETFVPLREELEFIDDYLNIEVIRFGRNVHERLRLLYGDQFKMDIRSQEGQGTQIHIEIPELAAAEPFAGLLE
jgi:sensor histidine kinase YesM